jgi:hypothetical protein
VSFMQVNDHPVCCQRSILASGYVHANTIV